MGSITRSFANLITANGPSAVANGSVTTADISGNINFKNIIINGDMSVAQRSDSKSGVTTTDGYYACDRWYTQTDIGTWTISQSTDVPSAQGFCNSLKLDCTSAGTSNADEVSIRYKNEGQNVQHLKFGTSSAQSVTVSFWIKSNKTGTYSLAMVNSNSSQERIASFTYTISSANTWEKKTITFPGDTSYGFDNTNGEELTLYWWFSTASAFYSNGVSNTWVNYNAGYHTSSSIAGLGGSTSDEVYLTGVQMEIGTSATDFEFLPKDVNLARCMRYYQNSWRTEEGYFPTSATHDDNDGMYECTWQDGNCSGPIFKCEMRSSPTMTYRGYSNGTTGQLTQSGATRSANSSHISSKQVSHVSITSGATSQWAHYRHEADAEL